LALAGAGGARLGFDDHRLLDDRLHRRGKRAADNVGGAARRKRIDQSDGVRRIGFLRVSRPDGKCGCRSGAAGDEMASVHVIPPWIVGLFFFFLIVTI
jgi:hypothetical protein